MAVCIFWLLTYVGQGLDLAVGNRPVIIVQGGQEQDYRHGGGGGPGIRKKSEITENGLLHLRIYPPDEPGQANWLLLNEEPRISSWTPAAGILLDDIVREPRDLQTVFFALSPAVLNLLYPEYAHPGPGYGEAHPREEPPGSAQQRAKKLWIDCKHSRNTLARPILVCDEAGRRYQEPRQSSYEDLVEQRLASATNLKKTELRRQDVAPPAPSTPTKEAHPPFPAPKPFLYETAKLAGKRNQANLGRRSVELAENAHHQPPAPAPAPVPVPAPMPGASVASQLMLRSTRGSIQYDVPQIECPVSEDGMERFACPTADRMGRYHCIDDHVLCDGFIDCPTGEDEDRQACMFYKTTKAHLDVLADAILRWARGR